MGENLLHLACRMGISRNIVEFLVEDQDGSGVSGAKVPLNVRDKFGRTPLHNACMSSAANLNFHNIDYLITKAPQLLVMEDDNGKIPFDVIPSRNYEKWTRFLSEKNILSRVDVSRLG